MAGMALFWTLFGCLTMVLRWQYRLKHDSQMPVVVEEDGEITVDALFKSVLEKIRRRKND